MKSGREDRWQYQTSPSTDKLDDDDMNTITKNLADTVKLTTVLLKLNIVRTFRGPPTNE